MQPGKGSIQAGLVVQGDLMVKNTESLMNTGTSLKCPSTSTFFFMKITKKCLIFDYKKIVLSLCCGLKGLEMNYTKRYQVYCSLYLRNLVKGGPKAAFSIATTPRCRWGRNSFPWIAPLYPWSLPYNAEC